MFRFSTFSALCVALLVSSTPAVAQAPRPERPYRGLFGSDIADTGQLLIVTGSLAGGYDDNLLADALGTSAPRGPTQAGAAGGTLAHFAGSLAYSLQSDSVALGVSAATSGRYYPSAQQEVLRSSQGRMTLAVTPREGTSVSGAASVAYQPYYLGGIFPTAFEPQISEAPVPDLDFTAALDQYLAYAGNVGLSQRLSRRTSITTTYGYRVAQRPGATSDFGHQVAHGVLTHNLGAGLGLRAGYSYGQGRYADGRRMVNHIIDSGVDYRKALSISRRTVVSFGTGSSATNVADRLRFRLAGSANLTHEIGRTWTAWGRYVRHVAFHETWQEPVAADAVTTGFGGLINRRLRFTSSARMAFGTVGIDSGAPGFDASSANASLAFALSRIMSAGLTYSYYHHRFDAGVLLPPGSPQVFDRHSVRANVDVQVPIVHRVRRADASR